MRLAERMVVATIAYAIKNACAGQLAEVRAAFDHRYRDRTAEWRQEIWAAAAERAASGKVSR